MYPSPYLSTLKKTPTTSSVTHRPTVGFANPTFKREGNNPLLNPCPYPAMPESSIMPQPTSSIPISTGIAPHWVNASRRNRPAQDNTLGRWKKICGCITVVGIIAAIIFTVYMVYVRFVRGLKMESDQSDSFPSFPRFADDKIANFTDFAQNLTTAPGLLFPTQRSGAALTTMSWATLHSEAGGQHPANAEDEVVDFPCEEDPSGNVTCPSSLTVSQLMKQLKGMYPEFYEAVASTVAATAAITEGMVTKTLDTLEKLQAQRLMSLEDLLSNFASNASRNSVPGDEEIKYDPDIASVLRKNAKELDPEGRSMEEEAFSKKEIKEGRGFLGNFYDTLKGIIGRFKSKPAQISSTPMTTLQETTQSEMDLSTVQISELENATASENQSLENEKRGPVNEYLFGKFLTTTLSDKAVTKAASLENSTVTDSAVDLHEHSTENLLDQLIEHVMFEPSPQLVGRLANFRTQYPALYDSAKNVVEKFDPDLYLDKLRKLFFEEEQEA